MVDILAQCYDNYIELLKIYSSKILSREDVKNMQIDQDKLIMQDVIEIAKKQPDAVKIAYELNYKFFDLRP
jgi:hypothetical protein